MRKICMETPALNSRILIDLLEEENPELVDEVWGELPFTCVWEHAMVSDKSIYCWVPMISLSPSRKVLLHTEAPVGCVQYSQRTGNKLLFKYGPLNEDLGAPVIGTVSQEYLPELERLGEEIWNNYYLNKEIIQVRFEAVEA